MYICVFITHIYIMHILLHMTFSVQLKIFKSQNHIWYHFEYRYMSYMCADGNDPPSFKIYSTISNLLMYRMKRKWSTFLQTLQYNLQSIYVQRAKFLCWCWNQRCSVEFRTANHTVSREGVSAGADDICASHWPIQLNTAVSIWAPAQKFCSQVYDGGQLPAGRGGAPVRPGARPQHHQANDSCI